MAFVSQDPKKPFDAPPGHTPELLQKEIPLDRRNRRVPTFEELQAQAPTDPLRPAIARPAPPGLRPHPIPNATVPASPRAIDNGPTAPLAIPRAAAASRPAPPAPGRAPLAGDDHTGVLPPRTSAPTETARTLPPSPAEWARMRGQSPGPLPQVTAGVPSLGASIPPGQQSPHRAPAPAPVEAPVYSHATTRPTPEPAHEPTTQPGARPPPPAASPHRPASPSFRSLPNVLPPEMLVTQPGMPGPFADKKRVAFQPRATPDRPPELDDAPPPSPAPAAEQSGPSLADYAALVNPRTRPGDVLATPAPVWRRIAAWLVDVSLVGGAVFGMIALAAQAIAGGLTPDKLPAIVLPAALLGGLLAFVYAVLFAFVWGGRTPGRRLLGLHLVDDSGHAPSPTRALVRGLLSLVSFGLFLAGFWVALFDRRGQTLHDKLSSTFVVRLHDA
ncbi:MAG: RDD family protein [Myxococcota bacterium]